MVAASLGRELAGGVDTVAEDGILPHKGPGGADVRHGGFARNARGVELREEAVGGWRGRQAGVGMESKNTCYEMKVVESRGRDPSEWGQASLGALSRGGTNDMSVREGL